MNKVILKALRGLLRAYQRGNDSLCRVAGERAVRGYYGIGVVHGDILSAEVGGYYGFDLSIY